MNRITKIRVNFDRRLYHLGKLTESNRQDPGATGRSFMRIRIYNSVIPRGCEFCKPIMIKLCALGVYGMCDMRSVMRDCLYVYLPAGTINDMLARPCVCDVPNLGGDARIKRVRLYCRVCVIGGIATLLKQREHYELHLNNETDAIMSGRNVGPQMYVLSPFYLISNGIMVKTPAVMGKNKIRGAVSGGVFLHPCVRIMYTKLQKASGSLGGPAHVSSPDETDRNTLKISYAGEVPMLDRGGENSLEKDTGVKVVLLYKDKEDQMAGNKLRRYVVFIYINNQETSARYFRYRSGIYCSLIRKPNEPRNAGLHSGKHGQLPSRRGTTPGSGSVFLPFLPKYTGSAQSVRWLLMAGYAILHADKPP